MLCFGSNPTLDTPRDPEIVCKWERAPLLFLHPSDVPARLCTVRPHPRYDPRSYRKARPQIKDLDTWAILAHLAKRLKKEPGWTSKPTRERAHWCCHWQGIEYRDPDTKIPDQGMGETLLFAKLRTLTFKGLVDGCTCGCRGDWTITNKGLERLFAMMKAKAS